MTKQLQLLPLAVLSLVRDILELNYCTALFHQTVHALSAQLCKTRRNIGVSRGIHHSNKTAFSIAFFAAFSAFFPHFSAFFANPGDRIPPPPPPLCLLSTIQMTVGVAEFTNIALLCNVLCREGVQCNVAYLGGFSMRG